MLDINKDDYDIFDALICLQMQVQNENIHPDAGG